MPRAIWTGTISFGLVNVPVRMYGGRVGHPDRRGLRGGHLGVLREGVITLEKMYFADEIRPLEGIAPPSVKVDRRALEMAGELIDRFAGTFQPEKYEDTYREALLEVIEAKRKGKEVRAPKVEAPAEPADLMTALRSSLEQAKGRRGGKPARSATVATRKRAA